jgi:hypothetical protein
MAGMIEEEVSRGRHITSPSSASPGAESTPTMVLSALHLGGTLPFESRSVALVPVSFVSAVCGRPGSVRLGLGAKVGVRKGLP